MAHMRNMSMNPLNIPLILIFRLGCDVKHDYKTFPKELVNNHFMGSVFFLYRSLCEPILQRHFFLKLMGNVSEMLFKVVDGYIVLRNSYPSALSVFEASKMSQKHFPLCSSSEVPWKLPQIFMLDKHWCTEVLLAPVKESVPQREMTLCHTGATRIYKHNSKRSRACKKASFVLRHPCPPVTYL